VAGTFHYTCSELMASFHLLAGEAQAKQLFNEGIAG
jgi:hypothetical protein